MIREASTPREGWKDIIRKQGLVYSDSPDELGRVTEYWHEAARYRFTMAEVLALEEVVEELHRMCLEAARFLAEENLREGSPWRDLGLPRYAVELAIESLRRGDPDLYGRFDLAYRDPSTPAKMLEYNADTPTGLVESAICQWYWKEDLHGYDLRVDQWNSLHEALVARWASLTRDERQPLVHVTCSTEETSGEDVLTTTYVQDCAEQAGIVTSWIDIADIGWDSGRREFVDLHGRPIRRAFKLYPWEDMMGEDFGPHVAQAGTRWLEPPWKMFLSTKALGAALWHLYPGHPNLLESHLGTPGSMREYVRKPLHGREGAGIEIVADGVREALPGPWGAEGYAYQAWHPLPDFPGERGEPNHPVLGAWVVNGESVGVGIRESDGYITDFHCRFVPQVIVG